MKDLLSNEEIDTLLQMYRAESDADAAHEHAELGLNALQPQGPVVAKVDLLKPNRLAREQIKNFERLFDRTARALGATIGDRLRFEAPCDCVAVEQMRFSSWLQLLGGPAAIYVVRMPPFDQPCMFAATSGLLYAAVDRILGGSGKVGKVPKELSAAEYTVADAFVGPCLDRICETFSDWGRFTWSIENRFANPSLAHILPAQEVVLSVHFQTSGESLLGDLRLVIPYGALEPHLRALDLGPGGRVRQPQGALRKQIEKSVAPVELDVSVVLGEAELSVRQLLELKPGDVVQLSRRLGEPLTAPVQGVPKFYGQLGLLGNRYAFQVAGALARRA